MRYRYMFGGYGSAIKTSCFTFTSRVALDKGLVAQPKLDKNFIAVKDTRNVRKKAS
jgi:urease subunit alpha